MTEAQIELQVAATFPAGTSVSAYRGDPPTTQTGAPQGQVDDTATVAADGSLFFNNLQADERYTAAASVSGTWRYIGFTPTEAEGSGEEEYDDPSSFQPISADFSLAAGAGKDAPNTAYLAAMMGNLIGDALTKTGDYLGGVIGAYSVTGAKASHYPTGAVLAQITDGVTEADGAVVAYIDGDSGVTKAGAAFKVRNNNSNVASGFDFGLDLQDAAHDGFQPVDSAYYLKACVRLVEDICLVVTTAAPTDGSSGTGAGVAGKGSISLNTSDGKTRTNTGTKASPTWTVAGTQS